MNSSIEKKIQTQGRPIYIRVRGLNSFNRPIVYIVMTLSVVQGLPSYNILHSTASDVPTIQDAETNPPSSVTSSLDCNNNVCVRKCCPAGQFFGPYYICQDEQPDAKPFQADFCFKDGRHRKVLKPTLLIQGFPTKDNCTALVIPEHRTALLLMDGTLYTSYDVTKIRTQDEYCVERMRELQYILGKRMHNIICTIKIN